MANGEVNHHEIAAVGITNQRETTVVWDKNTGEPVYNAIVWQCRRTAPLVDALLQRPGMEDHIRAATGLVPRIPTMLGSLALAGCGALSFVTGLILDTVAKSHRRQWEIDVYKALNGFYRE